MKEKLQKELIDAMKAHDKKKIDVIKLVKAAVQNEEINLKKELSDDEVLSIITKQVKMRKDAILEFEKASRNDLIESYNEEIDILSEYLPKSLTDEEAIKIIEDAFSVVNPQAISDMGKNKEDLNKIIDNLKNQLLEIKKENESVKSEKIEIQKELKKVNDENSNNGTNLQKLEKNQLILIQNMEKITQEKNEALNTIQQLKQTIKKLNEQISISTSEKNNLI